MRIFSQTLMTICDAELRQLFAIRNWRQPRDAYYQRIYGKTAALFAAASESAAVLGGAHADETGALREYGYNVGMAFQIMDDIFDFVGDATTIGKPVGSDLRQGTVTLPVFHFVQAHPDALQIMEGANNGHTDAESFDRLVADIGQSPAIEATRREAIEFIARAKALLPAWPDSAYRRALDDVADYVIARTL
jgi:geranylgeranyl pyrophosphate synthase